MKHELIQKLFAFIICMMFSFSFLHAQKCNGPNKILVCQCSRASDFYCVYVCKCIHVNQLKEHLKNGWKLSDQSDAAKINTTSSDLVSVSAINSTSIDVALDESQSVSLKIYDATGRLIKTIANGKMPQGYHQIEWDNKDEGGKKVSAGIYVLQIVSNGKSETRKLSIIK